MIHVGRRHATVRATTNTSQQRTAIASLNGDTAVRPILANIVPDRRNGVSGSTRHPITAIARNRIARVSFDPIHPRGDPR
ncbi:hypothetical protein [Natrialba asiatica]|uniref:Uncharacterized protein n=1 Tax=Natrialba asiatica (strain ATCC 700177 / DSM 12278 / JCM 9576 / FERM P-10747 / NBRC 102637 / 172P1) TaxID=29540 RepID=M0B6E3_NATA1|nr:hypothetical protein [Natrialba asiatica]ELZ05214.1 hypothetical protein C481_02812 [Natrialba asiatica DSM 12278]